MKPTALLDELRARGVSLHADGAQLRYNAPAGALTPSLRGEMKASKPELLELLELEAEGIRLADRILELRATANACHEHGDLEQAAQLDAERLALLEGPCIKILERYVDLGADDQDQPAALPQLQEVA